MERRAGAGPGRPPSTPPGAGRTSRAADQRTSSAPSTGSTSSAASLSIGPDLLRRNLIGAYPAPQRNPRNRGASRAPGAGAGEAGRDNPQSEQVVPAGEDMAVVGLSEERRGIIRDLEVAEEFDAREEIERRTAFLAERLTATGARALVLGISGGVDSSTAGRLCQLAAERVRAGGGRAEFIAMRLPYGVQKDEEDAQRALEFIGPDRVLTVDVKPA